MKKKIYLHYEPQDSSLEEFTAVYTVEIGDEAAVKNVFDSFTSKLTSKLPSLKDAKFALANSKFKAIAYSKIEEELEGGEDLFAIILPGEKKVEVAPALQVPSSSSAKPASNTPSSEDIKAIHSLMKRKEYKEAKSSIQKWLPGLKSGSETKEEAFLLNAMMTIHLKASRYDQAVSLGIYASKKYRQVGIEIYYTLAQAYAGREDYDEAVQCMDTALTLWASTTAQKFLSPLLRNDNFHFELVAYMAECLFNAGQHMEAAAKVNDSMSNPHANDHLDILVAYSRFALQYNKLPDAFNAVLKVIATIGTKPVKEQPEKARRLLADFFSASGAIALFQSKVPCNSTGSAEIYAYLGSTIKDFSQFDASLRLYEIALGADPANASYILNRAHIFEMKGDLLAALREMMSYFAANKQKGLNMDSKDGSAFISCGEVEALLRDEGAARDFAQRSSVRWFDGEDGYASVMIDGVEEAMLSINPVEYSSKDLDLLAVFSLVVKVLYLLDKRIFLPILIYRLEPVRRLSKKKLHETTVRNELAYYQDIVQIVSFYCQNDAAGYFQWTKVLSNQPNLASKPLYICGDSHCLSAAWAEIVVGGEQRRVVPKLVTGLKQWHLREKSTFHPKASFYNALVSIPERSEVIFIVGEIDCREGLLMAVEKDYYETVEKGIESTVNIFIKALQQLRKKKKLKIWVHPVAPVLTETRPIVVTFNRYFRSAVEKMKDAEVCWLDVFEQLLDVSADGKVQLREEFKHDGTHLRPSYVQHIEQAMMK